MNNLKSYTEYAVTSSTRDFVIGFDFNYGTDAVNVTVDDVPAAEAGYTVAYHNRTTIRLTPAVTRGVVRLQRETDIDAPDNRFTAGAKFIAGNMDENFTQIRQSQQEVRDGFNKLSTDTYAIIDTLQEVGQAAQDAADAAEAAAQTANDAAAQVNDKVSYQDLDDAVEVAVKNNTVYFYPTVAQMIASANLADGSIVATRGYHNSQDEGGATYLISATSTTYSIPLANGLHAVFRDSFDIRKFGIVSNKTLNQTDRIRRMIAYADSREYEIDFHNFFIMTPDIVQYTSSRGTIFRGMGFNYPHKIKNVKLVNNKSIPIYQGTTPIQFLPKQKGTGETFELENVRFDLYVADQTFISGEGDGRFHGFYAGWHPDYPVVWPSNMQSECGYKFKANGIYADTPAVTSTMALNLWFSDIEFKNMFGDYIGYYTTHFGTRVSAETCHGVYRDDLHASGRSLVTNFFQEEQEVGDAAFLYTQEHQKFKDVSATRHSDGVRWSAIKRQVLGTPTVNLLSVEDCPSDITVGQSTASRMLLKDAVFKRCTGKVLVNCSADNISCESVALKDLLLVNPGATIGKVNFSESSFDFTTIYNGIVVQELNIHGCTIPTTNVNGIVRANALINKIEIDGLIVRGGRIFECDFDTVVAKGITYTDTAIGRGFVRAGSRTTKSRINIDGMVSNVSQTGTATIVTTGETSPVDAIITNSTFQLPPRFTVGTGGSLVYANSYPYNQASVTYNPPSITAGDSTTTTVTLAGAVVGDFVQATFSQYNAGVELSAVVSATNTVTVKFKNTTAAAIDLPSGTLKVRLI